MDQPPGLPAELPTDDLSCTSLQPENSAKSSLQFSENSSNIVRCMLNERGIIFVKVDCASEDEPLTFTWSRDDIPIGNNDRFRITQTSKAVQLAIEHVQKDDTGHYTLYARTKAGEVLRKDVELIVEDRSVGEDPPVFLRRLGDLSVKVGTRTRLLVEIRSSTEVKVTWYRNDRRVCENDRIRYVHEGTFFCLEVAPVILEDGGQWMCMAENLGGRNSCIALLNVLVPKAYKAPEFIEELRAVLTEQGTVSLECKVIGIPTPVLRWFKDSKEIKAGDVFALTANPDDPTSLGTYTCEAVNCMGRAYSSSKVHVVGRGSREGSLKPADSVQYSAPPPIFTDELKDVKVKIGETIILGCKVVVPPWPKTVSWYNKEGRVDTSEKYRMIEDGLGVYMLEIKPSECCDEGEWKCVVTNNEGSVGISTCTVDMEIPKNYRKPRFMESLKAVLTEEGLVSFECKVVGFPTPILKWFKDGQELKPGDVYQLTGTNSLGTYCCVARNCMGESSSVAVLTVEDVQNQLNDEEKSFLIQRNQPPKFEIGLKSQEARINEDFQFMVKVKANPDALLTWFRDELPIETNEKYNIKKNEDGVCTMNIQRAEFVDQAEWKCTASNDFGTSVTSCFLKLQIPRHYKKPRFLECLRAVLTEEGAVNLECKVIGVPQPVLKWYKDGVELKPGDIHRIISGQDGTCCLGTYTCEARNCMGIVASSASLLGFEDANKSQNQEGFGEELQRNLSLSTIQEERTSQLYDTPAGDITIEEKGDVSFSFDGKEVSVSLYETPDLTEEEALQIVEMYADQISEHVTEHNVVELPPLRFVKETSQSGNLLMEAVVIDIAPEYFSHEEDMRTEAGMDDISINEITIHQLSSHRDSLPFDKEIGEEFEIDDQGRMPLRGRKRQKSTNGQDEFYSLSNSKLSDGGRFVDDDDTETDLQTFASVQESLNVSSHHTASLKEAEKTPAIENIGKDGSLTEPVAPKRKKPKKGPDSDSSRTQEGLAVLQDISGEAGDGLKLSRSLEPIRDDRLIRRNLEALVPLVKSLSTIEKNLLAIEGEVVCQSGMMMSANAAENSIGIISNIIDPIRQLQSKMKVYSGEIPLENLFETLEEDVKSLHRNLQVIEKCVEMDEGGRTLIQRTSVCIIDSCGGKLVNALEHVKQITTLFNEVRLKNELGFIVEDIQQGIQITQDTIKSQMLIQEASALETTQHFTETIAKLQTSTAEMPFEDINFGILPPDAHAVKIIYEPVVKLQAAIESFSRAVPSDTQQSLQNVSRNMINSLSESIDYLEAEVSKLEKNALTQAGRDSLEQKVNIAILDIVTPPLFELRRGLERIIQTESTGAVADSEKTTIDYFTLPLQEIHSGLAQLTQDIQTGQFSPDQGADQTADSQRLTQSIAQATINFRSNVENLAPRIDGHLHESLITLVDDVSKVIGEILNNPLDKYSLAILENLKSPIDDLNYCLRQTEERSSSGSLRYFVEPLRNLFERASICEDVLMLTGQRSNDYKVQSLKSVQKSVRNLERDIELFEAELLHQEILAQSNYAEELQEPQPSSSEALALSDFQRNINRIAITLEELQTCIAGIQENIVQQPLLAESLLSKLDKAQNCLSRMKNIAVLSTSREDEKVDNIDLLQNVSRPIRNAVESLQILTLPKEAARKDNTSVLKSISDSLREIKQCVDSNKDVSRLMAPLSELESCLEEVVKQIAPNSEDISTMEDVSAIASSAAESLPSAGGSSKKRVGLLLESLKHNLAEVLQSEIFESIVSMLPSSQVKYFANAIENMQSFEQKVAVVQAATPEEEAVSLSSMQNIASIQTLAERLDEINSCILQIQQEFAVEQIDEHRRTDGFEVIAAIGTPLVQVQHSIEIVQNMIMDAGEKLLSEHAEPEKLKIVQELQPLLLSIQETKALENVKYLVENEKREELRAILVPLQEIERVVLGQLQQHLSPVESITSIAISELNTLAQPLITLQEAVEKLQQTPFDGYSAFEILRECAEPVYEALQYIEKLNIEIFELANELSTQDDISALKTLAVSAKESALKNATETRIQIEDSINRPTIMVLIDDCLSKTSISKELPEAASAILTKLTDKFNDLKDLLSNAASDGSTNLEVNRSIAKALFKFREVLVHTYDDLADKQDLVDMLSDSLKTIEETLNEISQTIPNVEQLFANEIVANIKQDISELISSSRSVKKIDYLTYLESMRQSLLSMELELLHLNDVSADFLAKNSSPIIRMQVSLMDVFRAFNDICERADSTMLKPLIDAQNLLLSVNNFIEASEGEISKAELLQEIELLSKPFKEISELMKTGKFDQITSAVKVLRLEDLEMQSRFAESCETEAKQPDRVEVSPTKELKSVEEEPANLSTTIPALVKDTNIIYSENLDAKLLDVKVPSSEEKNLKNEAIVSSEIIEEQSKETSIPSINKIELDANENKTISLAAPKTHGDLEISTASSEVTASEVDKPEQASRSGVVNDSIETKNLYLTENEIKAGDHKKEEIILETSKDTVNEVSNERSLPTAKEDENISKNEPEEKAQDGSVKKVFEEDSSKQSGKETITTPADDQHISPDNLLALKGEIQIAQKENPSTDSGKYDTLMTSLDKTSENDELKNLMNEPAQEIEDNTQLTSPYEKQLDTKAHEKATLSDDVTPKLLAPHEEAVGDRADSANVSSDNANRKSKDNLKEEKQATNEALDDEKIEVETGIIDVKLDVQGSEEVTSQLKGAESTLKTEQSLLSVAHVEEEPSAASLGRTFEAEKVDLDAKFYTQDAVENVKLMAPASQDAVIPLDLDKINEGMEDTQLLVACDVRTPLDETAKAQDTECGLKPQPETTVEADNPTALVRMGEAPLSVETTEQKLCDIDAENVQSEDSKPIATFESDLLKAVTTEESIQMPPREECLKTSAMSGVPEISSKDPATAEMVKQEHDVDYQKIKYSESETIETQAKSEESKEITASAELHQAIIREDVEILEAIFMKYEKEIVVNLDEVFTKVIQVVGNIQATEIPLKLDKLNLNERSKILNQLSPILVDILDIIEGSSPEEVWSRIDNIRISANDLDEASLLVLEDVAPQLSDLLKLLTKVDKAVINNIINSLKKETSQTATQQHVDEGLKSVDECFAQLETLQGCSEEVTDRLRPIHQSIEELKEALTALKENPQPDGDQSQAVSKSLFKLRECLVHTYDDLSQRTELADSLEQPLRDVEKMLEALINSTPAAKKLFAVEMIGRSLGEISKFVALASAISQNESTQYWADVVSPFKNLEKSLRDLSDLNEEIMEKNSGHMVRLTTSLLEPFRALDDLRANVPLKMREPIMETQNCLVSLSSFIESADGKIDRINLLRKIESLASPMEKLVATIAKIMTTPVLSDDEIAKLIEPVEEAKLCLVEIQRKLTTGTETECELYLEEHGSNIDLLKKQLEKIETTILSKHDLTDLVPAEIAILANIVPLLTALQGTLEDGDARRTKEFIEQQQSETIEKVTLVTDLSEAGSILESNIDKTVEPFPADIIEVTSVPEISQDESILKGKMENVKLPTEDQEESQNQLMELEKLKSEIQIESQKCDRTEEIKLCSGTSHVSEVGLIQPKALDDENTLKAKEETGKEVVEAQNKEEIKKQDRKEVPKIMEAKSLEKINENLKQLNVIAAQSPSRGNIEEVEEISRTEKPNQNEKIVGTERHIVELPEGSQPEILRDSTPPMTNLDSSALVERIDEIPIKMVEEVKECNLVSIKSTEKGKEPMKESGIDEKSAHVEKQHQLELLKIAVQTEDCQRKPVESDAFHREEESAKEAVLDLSDNHPGETVTKIIPEESKSASEKDGKTKPDESDGKERETTEMETRTSLLKKDELKDVKEKEELKGSIPKSEAKKDAMSRHQEEEKSNVTFGKKKETRDVSTMQEIKIEINTSIEDTPKTATVIDVSEALIVANVSGAQMGTDSVQLVEGDKPDDLSGTYDMQNLSIMQQNKQKIEQSVGISETSAKGQVEPFKPSSSEVMVKNSQIAVMPEDTTQLKLNNYVMGEKTGSIPGDLPQHPEEDAAKIEKDKNNQDLSRENDIQLEPESIQRPKSEQSSSLEKNAEEAGTNPEETLDIPLASDYGTGKERMLPEVKENTETNVEQRTDKEEKLIKTEGKKDDVICDISVTSIETDMPIKSEKATQNEIQSESQSLGSLIEKEKIAKSEQNLEKRTSDSRASAQEDDSKDKKLFEGMKILPNIPAEAPEVEITTALDEEKYNELEIEKSASELENVQTDELTPKSEKTEQSLDSATGKELRENRLLTGKNLQDSNSGKNKQVAEDQIVQPDQASKKEQISTDGIATSRVQVGFDEKTDNLALEAIEEVSKQKEEPDHQYGNVTTQKWPDMQVNNHKGTPKVIETSDQLAKALDRNESKPDKKEDQAATSKEVLTKLPKISIDNAAVESSLWGKETGKAATMPISLDEETKTKSIREPKSVPAYADDASEAGFVESIPKDDLQTAISNAPIELEQISAVPSTETQKPHKDDLIATSIISEKDGMMKTNIQRVGDETAVEQSCSGKTESKSKTLEPAKLDGVTKDKLINKMEASEIIKPEAASPKEVTLHKNKSTSSATINEKQAHEEKRDIESVELAKPDEASKTEYKIIGKTEAKEVAQAEDVAPIEATIQQDKNYLIADNEKQEVNEVKQNKFETMDKEQYQATPENDRAKKGERNKKNIEDENDEPKQGGVETCNLPENLTASIQKSEDVKPELPPTLKVKESRKPSDSTVDEDFATKADTTHDTRHGVCIKSSQDLETVKKEASEIGDNDEQKLKGHKQAKKDSNVLSQIESQDLIEENTDLVGDADVDQKIVDKSKESTNENVKDTKEETEVFLQPKVESEASKSISSAPAKSEKKAPSTEKSTETELGPPIKDKSKEKSPSAKTRRSKKSPKTKAKDKIVDENDEPKQGKIEMSNQPENSTASIQKAEDVKPELRPTLKVKESRKPSDFNVDEDFATKADTTHDARLEESTMSSQDRESVKKKVPEIDDKLKGHKQAEKDSNVRLEIESQGLIEESIGLVHDAEVDQKAVDKFEQSANDTVKDTKDYAETTLQPKVESEAPKPISSAAAKSEQNPSPEKTTDIEPGSPIKDTSKEKSPSAKARRSKKSPKTKAKETKDSQSDDTNQRLDTETKKNDSVSNEIIKIDSESADNTVSPGNKLQSLPSDAQAKDLASNHNDENKAGEQSSGEANDTSTAKEMVADKSKQLEQPQAHVDKLEIELTKPEEKKRKKSQSTDVKSKSLEMVEEASTEQQKIKGSGTDTPREAEIEGGDKSINDKLIDSTEKLLEKDKHQKNVFTSINAEDVVDKRTDKVTSPSNDDSKTTEKSQPQVESESKLNQPDDESCQSNEKAHKKSEDNKTEVKSKPKVSIDKNLDLDASSILSDTEKGTEKPQNKNEQQVLEKTPEITRESSEKTLADESKPNKQLQAAPEKTDESVLKRSSRSRKKSKESNATAEAKISTVRKEEDVPSNGSEVYVAKPAEEKGKELQEGNLSQIDSEAKEVLDSQQSISKSIAAEKMQSDAKAADEKKPKIDESCPQATEARKKGVKERKTINEKNPEAEIDASKKTEHIQTTEKQDEAKLKVSDDSTNNQSTKATDNIEQDLQLRDSRNKDESFPIVATTVEELDGLAKKEPEKSQVFEEDINQAEINQPGVKFKKAGRSQGVSFNVYLTSQTVSVGNATKLVCNALGENITAKWYRNGEEIIGNTQKYFSQNKDGLLTLEIRDVEQSDAAEYKCVVANNGNSVETKGQLSVFNPAEFEVSEVKPIFTRCIRGMNLMV